MSRVLAILQYHSVYGYKVLTRMTIEKGPGLFQASSLSILYKRVIGKMEKESHCPSHPASSPLKRPDPDHLSFRERLSFQLILVTYDPGRKGQGRLFRIVR